MLSAKAQIQKWETRAIGRIIKDYSWLSNAFVAIGWDQNSGRYPDGTSVAQVAIWNEFSTHNGDGSVRTPARPFLRPAYDDNKPAINALRNQVVERINAGKMTPEHALNMLGFRLQTYIQSKIKANPGPPLAARTLAKKRRKGRPAVTLIDTRRMLDALTYKIYTGRFDKGTQTEQAKASQAAARRLSGDTAGKMAERAEALRNKMRTATQIKQEKQRLRDELTRAKSQAKREKSKLRTAIKNAKIERARLMARDAKRIKDADKRQKIADQKAIKKYKLDEARAKKEAQRVIAAAKMRAKKAESKRRKDYVKGFKKAAAKKSKYDKKMAKRDERQAKGLPRIAKLTPRQKEAKAAREKLSRDNRARLKKERMDDNKERRAEKKAKIAVKMAASRAVKAQRKTARENKAVREKAEKIRKEKGGVAAYRYLNKHLKGSK